MCFSFISSLLLYTQVHVCRFVCNGVRVQGEGTSAVFRSIPHWNLGIVYLLRDDCPLKNLFQSQKLLKKSNNNNKNKLNIYIDKYLENFFIDRLIKLLTIKFLESSQFQDFNVDLEKNQPPSIVYVQVWTASWGTLELSVRVRDSLETGKTRTTCAHPLYEAFQFRRPFEFVHEPYIVTLSLRIFVYRVYLFIGTEYSKNILLSVSIENCTIFLRLHQNVFLP